MITTLLLAVPVAGGESTIGLLPADEALGLAAALAVCGGICSKAFGGGGGDPAADVEPTEPGSLNPCVLLSSGVSKKLRLNSEPASKDTSGDNLSGDGAGQPPSVPVIAGSILNTFIVRICV